MHNSDVTFRDLHATRIHLSDGVAKWNLIGMPYNFKKLLRNASYTGHLSYTAPEIIRGNDSADSLTPKADIWSLGCCLFFLATKVDAFANENPKSTPDEIKNNILQN